MTGRRTRYWKWMGVQGTMVKNYSGVKGIMEKYFRCIVGRSREFLSLYRLILLLCSLAQCSLSQQQQNNTWLLVDMEFLFSCPTLCLTRKRVEHSKRNSIYIYVHPCIILYWSVLVGVIFSQVSPSILLPVADLITWCQEVKIQFYGTKQFFS